MTKDIHFVSGKGGTGKSFIAAAMALRESRRGRKTLLVELGDRSFYKDLFGLESVGYQPTPLGSNLDVALWSGTESLKDYARSLIKIESLTRLFFENSVTRSLVEIAPALPELAILGKITSGPRHHGPPVPHEVIVVDAFSTGHFLAMMRAPKGLAEAVRFGPMGEQSRSIDAALRDPKLTHVHVVTLPEEMPLQETEELVSQLKSEFAMNPSVVLNKVVPIPGDIVGVPHPFAEFLREADERQRKARVRLGEMSVPFVEVPLLFEEDARAAQAKAAEAWA